MTHPRFNQCDTIKINWLCYGDNEILYYENKNVQKRFQKHSNLTRCNSEIKSIIKINNNSKILWGNGMAHRPIINVNKSCDSAGNLRKYTDWMVNPPQHKYAYLKHYFSKSTEEYAKKILRGDAAILRNNDTSFYARSMKRYFALNSFSMEKIFIFEKILNVSLKKALKKIKIYLKKNKT